MFLLKKVSHVWDVLLPAQKNIVIDAVFLFHPDWQPLVYTIYCLRRNLKLPSVFAAWLFWTFHNKSHNMKALVILSHSWSSFLPLTCLYGKNEPLRVSVQPSEVFSWEKTSPRLPMQITWPWPPVGRFCYGLITVRQKNMWT